MDIIADFMSAIINAFEANKRLADRAVEQVPDDNRPDRSGCQNPHRGKVEYADDSQGRFGTIQQGSFGPDRESAFVDRCRL